MPLFRRVPFFPRAFARYAPSFPGGLFTSPLMVNDTDTPLANETGVVVNFYDPTSGVLMLQKTGQTSDSSGIISFNTGLPRGNTYTYEVVLTSNGRGLPLVTLT